MNNDYIERCFYAGLVVLASPLLLLGWIFILAIDCIKKGMGKVE